MDNSTLMSILKMAFWLSLLFVFYSTLGYFILLQVIVLFRNRPVKKSDILPSVSLLIAARNEERVIATKLENCLNLDYPAEKLQIIVASDASTDRTDEIVRSFAERGVILKQVPDGMGKVNALNATISLTNGDILVISDADSAYQPDALRRLVRGFADPEVGAITGEEIRIATRDGEGMGESIYVRLDNRIKRLEGTIGSMVMVNGGFFAIRRQLYPVLEPHLIHDSLVPCSLQLQGFRTAYEPEAISVEVYAVDAAGDFHRRQRTVIQAFYSYLSEPAVLNPFRTGFFSFEILSHRFSRWFVLPFLALALLCSALLSLTIPFYRLLLAGQGMCYLLAGAGYILDRSGIRPKLFYVPYYFLYIHTAAFLAVIQGISGRRVSTWRPTQRTSENTSGIL